MLLLSAAFLSLVLVGQLPGGEPDPALGVDPREVPTNALLLGSPDEHPFKVGVVVIPPEQISWIGVADHLQEQLRASLRKDRRVRSTRSFLHYSTIAGLRDEEIAKLAADQGCGWVVLARLEPTASRSAPVRVTFHALNAMGETVQTVTSTSVVVPLKSLSGEAAEKSSRSVITPDVNMETDSLAVKDFHRRALQVKVLEVKWSTGQTTREVMVFNGEDHQLSLSEIAEISHHHELSTVANIKATQEKVLYVLRFAMLLPLLAIPAGLILGGLVGAGFGLTAGLASSVAMFGLFGVAGGAFVGLVLGIVVAFALTAPMLIVAIAMALLTPSPSEEQCKTAVHEFNEGLAKELGVDPLLFGQDYFPLR